MIKDFLFPIFLEAIKIMGERHIEAPIPINVIRIISEGVKPFTVVKNTLSIIVLKNTSRLKVVYKT